MSRQIEYTFAALDDEEWELLTPEKVAELYAWFDEKATKYYKQKERYG